MLGAVAGLRWVLRAGLPPQCCFSCIEEGATWVCLTAWSRCALKLLCLYRCQRGEQHLRGLVHRAAVLGQQPSSSHLCWAGRWPGLRDGAGEGHCTRAADSTSSCEVSSE